MKLKSILLTAVALLNLTYSVYSQTYGNGMVDIDGNNYPTVIIGNQEWMSENLRVSKYDNGDNIPNIVDNSTWNSLTTGAFCWYNHNNGYDASYGKLYNWFTTVDSRSLCPSGWRVPSDNDFAALISYLDANANNSVNGIESTIAGGLLKESGTSHWNTPNVDATNSTGFSARGTGSRSWWDFDPNFGEGTLFWTTNQGQSWEGISRWVQRGSGNSGRGFNTKESGFSVRCMKDYQGCSNDLNVTPTINNINIGDVASFVATTSEANPNYIWQTDLGVGFQNLNEVGQYSGTTTNTLTVSIVTMSNNNQPFRCIISYDSCSDTSNVAVLTVNNNVGINETSQDKLFSVFPNPAQSVINVKADSKLIGSFYSIYDNTGRVVLSGKINSENTTIELGNLSGGVYMLSVGENMKQTFKVIKE
jgi:uncharacterized protein (TIGR02145 family)